MPARRKRVLFRRTKSREGVTNIINPRNSDLDFIRYSRIRLAELPAIRLSTGNREALIVVLENHATLRVGRESYGLSSHDVVYIPRDETYTLSRNDSGPLTALLFETPAVNRHGLEIVRFDQASRKVTGAGSCEREVFLMVSEENIKADRLILGYCWGMPGGWTGWPPHEHTETLEELYVFYDIPPPGFALQLIYDRPDDIRCLKVEDGDAVAISGGFHPVVAVPGYRMKNIWVMAAKRPIEDRHLHLAKVESQYI